MLLRLRSSLSVVKIVSFRSVVLIKNRKMTTKNYVEKIDKNLEHLFGEFGMNLYNSEIINLIAGAPGPDLLKQCCKHFEIATQHRMKYELENHAYLFQYGPNVGIQEFRQKMSGFLSKGYGDQVHHSDIVLTNGASGGLHLILSTLIDMEGIVFVDEVSYMIALRAISQFTKMKIVPVPMTKDGVNVYELEKLIKKHKFISTAKDKIFWGLYYTIPTYHNPTGITFSDEICKELINLSREHDFLIACDDVYNLLNYSKGMPPKRLFAYDNNNDISNYRGNVISNGSFSKILSPGVRVGWMECPPRCVQAFYNSGIVASGGAVNNYTSGIITSLIELGLAEKQLKLYTKIYKERMESVLSILKEKLPNVCSFNIPEGGYFIWIELPKNIDGNDLNRFLRENYKVVFITGDKFSITQDFKNCFRITIGFHDVNVLKDGTERLCTGIKEYLKLSKL